MPSSDDLIAIQVDVARLQEQSKTAFTMLAEVKTGLNQIRVFLSGLVLACAAIALQFVAKSVGLM